jgi:hypothetical protein
MGAIDMAKYADRGNIEVLPAGTYKVALNKYEKCVARTGMEQIRYYATVAEGDHMDAPLIDHIALSDAAHWRIAWFIKEALGWEKEDMQNAGKMEIGSERFNRCLDLAKGRTMFWVVSVDPTYNNNKVMEYINDPDAGKVEVDQLEDVPDWVKNKQK